MLAVRKVAEDNKGKNTPGVDGVASLTPVQRNKIAARLKLDEKVTPIRRVWIIRLNWIVFILIGSGVSGIVHKTRTTCITRAGDVYICDRALYLMYKVNIIQLSSAS